MSHCCCRRNGLVCAIAQKVFFIPRQQGCRGIIAMVSVRPKWKSSHSHNFLSIFPKFYSMFISLKNGQRPSEMKVFSQPQFFIDPYQMLISLKNFIRCSFIKSGKNVAVATVFLFNAYGIRTIVTGIQASFAEPTNVSSVHFSLQSRYQKAVLKSMELFPP